MEFETAYNKMAALCSASEHCESDVRERLRKAAISVNVVDEVVDRLYADGFLDVARYCRAFAHDRLRFARWGRMKIAQALRVKGLPDADIREAVEALPEEEYRAALHATLEQKGRALTDADDYTRRGKLMRFAAARGFTPGEITDALDA